MTPEMEQTMETPVLVENKRYTLRSFNPSFYSAEQKERLTTQVDTLAKNTLPQNKKGEQMPYGDIIRKKALVDSSPSFFVFDENESLIGCYVAYVASSDFSQDQRVIHASLLSVLPEHRILKLEYEMIQKALADARKLHMPIEANSQGISLQLLRHKRTQKMLRKSGFLFKEQKVLLAPFSRIRLEPIP